MATTDYVSPIDLRLPLTPHTTISFDRAVFTDINALFTACRLMAEGFSEQLADTITEAPEDGILYGRRDGNWEAVPGGAGYIETIVPGTGITVDNTDPANPVVSATSSGAPPILVGYGSTGSTGTASATAFATKGIVFKPDVDITLTALTAYIDAANASTELYSLGIAELTGVTVTAGELISASSISSIIETGTPAATGITDLRLVKQHLSAPRDLVAGTYYLLYASVTSGTGTTVARVGVIATGTNTAWDINFPGVTYWGACQYNTIVPSGSPTSILNSKFNLSFEGYITP